MWLRSTWAQAEPAGEPGGNDAHPHRGFRGLSMSQVSDDREGGEDVRQPQPPRFRVLNAGGLPAHCMFYQKS